MYAGEIKLNIGRTEAELERSHVALLETDSRTLPGKPQPNVNTEINRNGLYYYV